MSRCSKRSEHLWSKDDNNDNDDDGDDDGNGGGSDNSGGDVGGFCRGNCPKCEEP